jgi:hypothetical protein
MPIRGEGLDPSLPSLHPSDDSAQKVVYVLHPNCAIEEM